MLQMTNTCYRHASSWYMFALGKRPIRQMTAFWTEQTLANKQRLSLQQSD